MKRIGMILIGLYAIALCAACNEPAYEGPSGDPPTASPNGGDEPQSTQTPQ